jgi:hypothetical protein
MILLLLQPFIITKLKTKIEDGEAAMLPQALPLSDWKEWH